MGEEKQPIYYDKDGNPTDNREDAVYSPGMYEEPDGSMREVIGILMPPDWVPQYE